jgi:hypothetical protein
VDQVSGVVEETVDGIRQIPGDLLHPRSVGVVGDAGQVYAPGLEIDHEQDRVADQPVQRQDLDVEEVRSGDGSQWAFRNVAHGVRLLRSGAGSIPASAKMRLIVLRPRS